MFIEDNARSQEQAKLEAARELCSKRICSWLWPYTDNGQTVRPSNRIVSRYIKAKDRITDDLIYKGYWPL